MSSRLAILLCGAFVSGCVSTQRQERAASRAELGAAYLREQNPANAVVILEEAVKLDSRNAQAWEHLGLAYMAQGAPEESERALQRAVRLAPDTAEIRNTYGILLMSEGRYTDAIAQFEQALKDRTYDSPAMVMSNLGFALHRDDQNALALSYLTEAIDRAPNLCQAWFNRGLVYTALRDDEMALSDFESALGLCDADGAYLQAGELRLKKGDPIGGCQYLKVVAQRAPHSAAGRSARSRIAQACHR
ncbi:MAG: tetratricopeptide repeat protein [Myxococcota bacterium]